MSAPKGAVRSLSGLPWETAGPPYAKQARSGEPEAEKTECGVWERWFARSKHEGNVLIYTGSCVSRSSKYTIGRGEREG